ncbi:hypothetical protein [Erwinia sp. V71]|uniref:hypothetical protein n=1 Tax=Erwinia sp. V71 TaxID=3369424 RepID=UPI003F609FC7
MNKKRVYGYAFVGVICLLIAFGRMFSNLSEPGMGFFSSIISIVSGWRIQLRSATLSRQS